MDFISEINSLLYQKNYKSIGDKFYLPFSSSRPSRNTQIIFSTSQNFILPAPMDSFCKKFLESVRILESLKNEVNNNNNNNANNNNNSFTTNALQPVLNICKEFFIDAIEYFGLESTQLDQGEWILRAATCNYIFVGLLISKAAELEVDGDERIGDVFHSIKKYIAQMNKKDESKRPIIIFLFSECFKLMFKLKRLGLFPSLITSIQILGSDKLLSRSRKSDSVQYQFYRALYEFHGQKFKESWDRFLETWNLLHPEDWNHRRKVATYLITLALCHGKCPSSNFLKKYNLFSDLSNLTGSIMSGDHLKFQRDLNNLHNFQNSYTFLLLNAQPALNLNLIKRTWKLTNKSSILTFEQIKLVATYLKNPFHVDELECIIINLLGKGWIKGKLNHNNQCLILNPSEPFPVILK